MDIHKDDQDRPATMSNNTLSQVMLHAGLKFKLSLKQSLMS